MAAASLLPACGFLFLLCLLLAPPPTAESLTVGQARTLVSISSSLMSRVANLRAARGDHAGAGRARAVSGKLSLLGGGWSAIWSAGWDFARYYVWGDGLGRFPAAEAAGAAAGLAAALAELSAIDSGAERARWIARNYPRLRARSKDLMDTLLLAFSRSGPLRDAVMVFRKEVVEGELLKDCMEIGAKDVEGLFRIARDVFSSMSSSYMDEL